MRDITDLMDHYRHTARSLWNTGFWAQAGLRTWDARDQFEQIRKLLFKALVVARLEDGHCCDLDSLPGNRTLHIVPSLPTSAPILIQRGLEKDQIGYWDDPVRQIAASETELHLIDFFDWDLMNYADFQYYRVQIAAFPAQPHLVGREALLEHLNARVYFDSPAKA